MTKFLLYCTTFLLVFSLNSQNLNVANHTSLDWAGKMVSINSKIYYIERLEHDCCTDSLNIVAMNDQGQTLWKRLLKSYEFDRSVKLIVTKDLCLSLLGIGEGCDTGFSKSYFSKVDTLGNLVFGTSLNIYPVDICHAQDNFYYITSSNQILKFTSSGYLTDTVTISLSNISSLRALDNGNLLVSSLFSGVQSNVEITTSGAVVNSKSSTAAITRFVQHHNGSFFGMSSGGILGKYNAGLQYISNTALLPIKIVDFCVKHDSIFVTGTNTVSSNSCYMILDTNLSVKYQKQLNYNHIQTTGIVLDNKNRVYITSKGTTNSSLYYISTRGVYLLPINGDFAPASDVGVVSYTTVSADLAAIGSNGAYSKVNLDVTVKNFGVDTIKTFYLNNFMREFLCIVMLHKSFQMSIPPGASAVVNTGEFWARAYSIPPGNILTPGNLPDTVQIFPCMFTSIPNGHHDANMANDWQCNYIKIITSLNEISNDEKGISVFPNPSTKSFLIKSDEVINTIEIQNLQGALILKEDIQAKQTEVNKYLVPGIYILKVLTEKGVLTRKIVRTN